MTVMSMSIEDPYGSIVIGKGIQKVRLLTRAQPYIRTQLEATRGPMMTMCPISVIFGEGLIHVD